MIKIRVALERDAETISKILISSIQLLCVDDHRNDPKLIAGWIANKNPENIIRWINNPKVILYLATRLGKAAGVGCVSEDGEVLLNYVDPAHRFCGVSRAILTQMERASAGNGVTRGMLTSTQTAHRFYQSAGWCDVGKPEVSFNMIDYPMEKNLDPCG
jgi:hypothetical protein